MSHKKIKVVAKPGIFNKGGSNNANRLKTKYEEKAQYESQVFDNFVYSGDYKERQSKISYELLKIIAENVAPIAAIIGTRIEQIGQFTSPARYKDNGLGFRVKLKDSGKESSEEQLEQATEIENFIYRCGVDDGKERDDFDTFVKKVIRDSLTYDQLTFEKVRNVDNKLVEMIAVDAATIRSATEDYEPSEELTLPEEGEEVSYVQVIQDQIVAWFTHNELAFCTRNPRTDINVQPYGFSEIETIVKQLSSYLDTEEYNMRFFSQGGMAKGILNIKEEPNGIADQSSLESFKRQWRTQVSGQKGAWKIPVFQLPGQVEFINIAQSGGEMVFEKWINYLINVCCAVYKIDPAEINFPNNGGVGGTGGGIFEGSNSEKYKQSKSKGLVPLLQFLQNMINKHIISEFGDDFIFVFEGIDEKSEEETIAIDKDRVANFMTVNEIREERGLQPIDGGDIILNPYYLQANQGQSDDGFSFGDFDKSRLIEKIGGDDS